jgi:hypothetical protein
MNMAKFRNIIGALSLFALAGLTTYESTEGQTLPTIIAVVSAVSAWAMKRPQDVGK